MPKCEGCLKVYITLAQSIAFACVGCKKAHCKYCKTSHACPELLQVIKDKQDAIKARIQDGATKQNKLDQL